MTTPYLGEIRAVGWPFAQRGWALCAGQLLSIQQNTALFSLLGTYYGGNGVNNFALPDLRGRAAIGQGQSPSSGSTYTIGQNGGTETVTLNVTQLPQHNHMWQATTTNGNQVAPLSGYLATVERPPNVGTVNAYAAPGGPAIPLGTPVGNTGGNQPHANIQPFSTINYSIALQGIYPSRN
jgi:microcystin-dependent protein